MSDRWTDLLSDHLDGDLAAAEDRALTRHLESCEECRATLEQLRRVKERARTLVDPPAPDDLWAGIASRLGPAGSTSDAEPRAPRVQALSPHRSAWSPPLALAAGIALLLVSAGALWLALHRTPGAPAGGALATGPTTGEAVRPASFDAAHVESEIADLQRALDRGRGKLDPKTIAVLEKNLKLIREATEDARRALAQDPANRDLQDYFAGTVQRKVDMMRRASALAGV